MKNVYILYLLCNGRVINRVNFDRYFLNLMVLFMSKDEICVFIMN